uniref:Limb region 1-like protein n=1 Tax=Magallana gigas TaxID=29159 RepID=K1QP66_MAGGI
MSGGYFKFMLRSTQGYIFSVSGEEDAVVYRIALWMCTFTLSVSVGAILLLPVSIVSNEVLLLYPKSYYVQWLNSSLIIGFWNNIFLISNLSLFFFMPFAYFFTESEGFVGVKKSRLVQKAILKSQIWDSTREKLPKRRDPEYPRYKIDREYGIPLEKRLNMLSFDLLRMADTAVASQYPEIGRSRRLIFYPNGMATFFKYSDSLLSFYLGIDAAITSTSPLPPFVPEELVESSSSEAIPSLYPISPTIDFLKTNNYNLKNSIGFSEISCKFPHTLILLNNDDWSEDERQARALVTAMGLAVAQVKKTYPGIKDRLPTPISVQVINMSETTMNFTYFQLNTIDFDNSEAGVKNFVWFDTGNVLFERRLPQPWKRDKILGTSLENLDLDPFKKLLATVGNCAELEDSSTQFKEKLIEL